jgi:uncharacterized protein (TIGR02246 family)
MRRLKTIATALLLAAAACAPALAQEGDDVSAQDCFLAGFRAGDAAAVTACYAPDAVLWIPGAPMAKGKQAIHAMLEGYFAAVTIKSMTIEHLGGQTVGDDSVGWGTFTLVTVAKDTGAETTAVGRYVDVSRRIDGKWVYVVDHASDDPPAPAVPAQ